MSDAEVHGARAFMYAATGRSRSGVPAERVRAEIAEALNADPAGTTEALAVQYYALGGTTSPAERRALADQASRAHPQTEMAWLMVADAAQLSDVRQTALSWALALAPNDAEVLARMALLKASVGKWNEAVAFSRKAVRLRAMSPQVLNLHINALEHTGQCKEAAFFMAALSAPPVASGTGVSAIPAAWRELHERCVQIAAERAKQRAESPADGEGHDDAEPL
jgi:hypothetical protein